MVSGANERTNDFTKLVPGMPRSASGMSLWYCSRVNPLSRGYSLLKKSSWELSSGVAVTFMSPQYTSGRSGQNWGGLGR